MDEQTTQNAARVAEALIDLNRQGGQLPIGLEDFTLKGGPYFFYIRSERPYWNRRTATLEGIGVCFSHKPKPSEVAYMDGYKTGLIKGWEKNDTGRDNPANWPLLEHDPRLVPYGVQFMAEDEAAAYGAEEGEKEWNQCHAKHPITPEHKALYGT